jgi:hypothetical protein
MTGTKKPYPRVYFWSAESLYKGLRMNQNRMNDVLLPVTDLSHLLGKKIVTGRIYFDEKKMEWKVRNAKKK